MGAIKRWRGRGPSVTIRVDEAAAAALASVPQAERRERGNYFRRCRRQKSDEIKTAAGGEQDAPSGRNGLGQAIRSA